jgi:signal peptidase I
MAQRLAEENQSLAHLICVMLPDSNPNQLSWIQIDGNSMSPFFHSGDLIHVKWKALEKPEIGELILGKSGDLWIIHRIIGDQNQKYLIKGDSSYTSEELTSDEIWGKVIAWKKSGTDLVIPFQKNYLDVLIATLGRLNLRKPAKLVALLRKLLS